MEVEEAISFDKRKELMNKFEFGSSQPIIRKQMAKRSIDSDDLLDTSLKRPKVQNENTMLQQQTLQQNNQKEKLVQQNNHSNDDELNRIISFDVDLERVGEVEAVKKKLI